MTRSEATHIATMLRIRAAQAHETAKECLRDGAERVFHYYDGRTDALNELAACFEAAAGGSGEDIVRVSLLRK